MYIFVDEDVVDDIEVDDRGESVIMNEFTVSLPCHSCVCACKRKRERLKNDGGHFDFVVAESWIRLSNSACSAASIAVVVIYYNAGSCHLTLTVFSFFHCYYGVPALSVPAFLLFTVSSCTG